MYCFQVDIPHSLCEIDDELKAIYRSKDSVCIWVFGSSEDRNNFADETTGMLKKKGKFTMKSTILQKLHSSFIELFLLFYINYLRLRCD